MDVQIGVATTIRDYMEARRIRNECRHNMTRDSSNIGVWRQLQFWWNNRSGQNSINLYLLRVDGTAIGYGLVDRAKKTVSGGILKDHRCKGYGDLLFAHLTKTVPKPATLEVFRHNLTALALYKRLGWRLSRTEGEIHHMNYEGIRTSVGSPQGTPSVGGNEGQAKGQAAQPPSPPVRKRTRQAGGSTAQPAQASRNASRASKALTRGKAKKAPSAQRRSKKKDIS